MDDDSKYKVDGSLILNKLGSDVREWWQNCSAVTVDPLGTRPVATLAPCKGE